MSPPNDSQSGGNGIIASRIDACEAPAYHISSHIQMHGLLLVVDAVSLLILRISDNAGSILGLPNDILLGASLSTLLTTGSFCQVRDLLVNDDSDAAGTPRTSLMLDFETATCFSATAFLYRSGSLVCIELEPPEAALGSVSNVDRASRFFGLVDRVGQTNGPSAQLPELACEALREVTGFDRIYFCRFDRLGHGHVLGESNNGVLPNLMDHHFPATDIPEAARRIFVVNPFRLIADVNAPPVAIIGGDGSALNLTHSTCRAVADTHLRYLRNMNVGASMSFSVVVDGRLEALFGGHHHAPKRLSFRQMVACQHLVQLFKARFDALRLREDQALLKQGIAVLHDLAARFLLADCDLGTFIASHHDIFCDLMDADDVLCRFERQCFPGRLLPAQLAGDLVDFLSHKITTGTEVFQSVSLVSEDPRFGPLCPAVAGALAVSLDLSGNNIIVWLRSEAVVAETWSGDPHQATLFDKGSISPRTSFLAYVRKTKGTSRTWPSAAGDLAQQLRYTFSQALARYYEIKIRKAAEQAMAIKTEFIANVTHELRSPMHAIIGFSELLIADDGVMPEDKRKRFQNTILDSGRRLLHLIDDLLDLSRLDAGKMPFAFIPGDLRAIVERVVAALDALARSKDIEIVIRDDRHQHITTFDPARIEQVMINLLSNALKFSPTRSCITVSLGTTTPGHGPSMLIVEVSDQGVGIPDDELDAIFDKFIQSSRTKSGAGGTGLGLAICREIIDAHHGRIWAASNAAGGASLFIGLPQIAQDHSEVAP